MENADTAEVYERGHIMFMHNDDVDVRYAEFHELGRTDKSETARDASEFANIAVNSNVKGRYRPSRSRVVNSTMNPFPISAPEKLTLQQLAYAAVTRIAGPED